MSALWTAEEAAAATGGRTSAGWVASGVAIDSRTTCPGDLFVALHGPNRDGHEYVADAFARGAAAAMVEAGRAVSGGPLLTVTDTQAGLNALAGTARSRARGRIVAITGSTGKTGTKEALALVLAREGATEATRGNLNNHWGLPLSLARLPADSTYGVFEMGMNHAHEIEPLSRLARPHVAVVTNVGAVHLEYFESVEAIADAKAEIFLGMDANGAAVLNRDDPHFTRLAERAKAAGITRIVSFGSHDEATVRLVAESLHATCSAVTASVGKQAVDYCLGLPGRHWVRNSLAVLAAVKALGADVVAAAQAFSELQPLPGRGRRSRVPFGTNGAFTVIDESYNASPMSVRAALDVLGRAEPAGGRRIAVLGDMLELGPKSEALHAQLADAVKDSGVDLLFTAGRSMAALAEAVGRDRLGAHCSDSASLLPYVTAAVQAGDVVMVKGSLGSRMTPIVEALLALGRPSEATNEPRAAVGG